MKLGIHDVMPGIEGLTTQELYQNSIELVTTLEKEGYHRYWVAEHHDMDFVGSSTPEIFIAYLAAITDTIRLGSGGTMVMHYSPLKIAEVFKTLSVLAPNRIDLGIGRAPGGGRESMIALAGDPSKVDMSEPLDKVETILDYLLEKNPKGYFDRTTAIPRYTESKIEPWILASTGNTAIRSGELGLPYSLARFFGMNFPENTFDQYRKAFKPSEFFDKPITSMSYWITLADTEEEANFLARPGEIAMASNNTLPIMDPEKAKDYAISSEAQERIEYAYQQRFLLKGTPDQVEAILAEEVEKYGLDEVLSYMPIYDIKDKIYSYKLLAKIFNK